MKREINILHLEDSIADSELIRLEIERALPNATIQLVHTKEDFIKYLESENFKLIISDYNIPGITDMESLHLVKKLSPNTPLIYVSGEVGEERAVELLREGATDYVLKNRLSKLPIAIQRSLKEMDDRELVKKKEEELKKSNEFRSSILNALSIHIAVLDQEGVIVETNNAWEGSIRQDRHALQGVEKGENYLERIEEGIEQYPEFKYILENIRKVINGEYKYFYNDYQCTNLQQEKWYTIRVTPRIDGKGVVIAHSNITERVLSEKKWRTSEREFRTLTENAPNIIVKLNHNFQVEYINKGVLGFEQYELIGKNAFQLIDPANSEVVRDALEKVMRTGEADFLRTVRSHDVEEPMHLGAYIGPVFGDKGAVKSLILIIRDMTREVKDEELLRESEERFRGIFEGMSEGILMIDEKGVIESVNPGFCEMVGYEQSELIGQVCYDFLHDETSAQRLRKKMDYRRKGEKGRFEIQFVRKDGKEVWGQVSSQPKYDKEGNFNGVMSIIMDITEKKNTELKALEMKEAFTRELEAKVMDRTRELEEARIELTQSLAKEKELGELKSRFVSTASHQFRTPLSIIQTNMGILSMQKQLMGEEFVPKFDGAYERIKEQIERMTELMNDVLILGKINAGNISIRLKEIDLVELCEQITNGYNQINTNKRIATEILGKPYIVTTDSKLFEHSLSNFVSNALKYSPENSESKLKLDFSGDQLLVSIKDNGIGIPEEELPHLFEPFYRASNAKSVAGTGLGTAIAKEYLELIGGQVAVQSEVGKGTEIMITFKNQSNGKDSGS